MEEQRSAGMRGRNDMTTGPEWKQIVLFSLPIMIGQFLQQLYNTVDGIVVGNFVSQDALAAVGGCASLTMAYLAVCMGMGNGCAVLIAQLFGAKRYGDLRRAASTVLIMLGGLGLAFSVLGVLLAKPLLRDAMNIQDPAVLRMAVSYFSIYAVGLVFQYLYNAVAFVLRAVGDSRATLYFLCITAGLNLGLDLLFVIVFGWGVVGAAAATILAQLVCVVFSYVYMIKEYPIFAFKRREFVFDKALGRKCVKLGVPTTVQQCIISFGNVFLQRLVNGFGTELMAAYSVGIRIQGYIFIPIFALNGGIATFTGQNIGAGKPDRVRRGMKYTLITSLIVTVAVSLLVSAFAEPVARLFGVEERALEMSIEMLRFICRYFIVFSLYMPTGGVLQGSGDVVFVSISSLVNLGIRVGLAYALVFVFHYGYASVWSTMPVGWAAGLIMSYARFYSGKWKNKAVVRTAQPGEELTI
jgi:putative MATE family efflux protein